MGHIVRGKYGISVSTHGPFGDAVERVKAVFKDHGFGTLSEIDVQATLRDKIGEEIEPYTILGMCNPSLAAKAIDAEHEVGLLLPCNVLVHECEGRVHVAAQDPELMVGITGNNGLSTVAADAAARLRNALESLD